jgi:hypothetical protein
VLVLVIVLVGTNLLTLGGLAWLHLRPQEHPAPDPLLAASLESMRPPTSTSSLRRIITIEVLNPIELAGTRGRLAGIAGSLAPGITRRIVYDQVIRNLRHQLVQERVVADVRLHQVRPATSAEQAGPNHPSVVEVVEMQPTPEPSTDRPSEG